MSGSAVVSMRAAHQNAGVKCNVFAGFLIRPAQAFSGTLLENYLVFRVGTDLMG